MHDMDDFIKTFDNIVQDSFQKGIPVFFNPLMKSFFQQYNNEFSQPETYGKLNRYLEDQRRFDAEYQTGISTILPANVKVVQMGNEAFLGIKDNVYIKLISFSSLYGILR